MESTIIILPSSFFSPKREEPKEEEISSLNSESSIAGDQK